MHERTMQTLKIPKLANWRQSRVGPRGSIINIIFYIIVRFCYGFNFNPKRRLSLRKLLIFLKHVHPLHGWPDNNGFNWWWSPAPYKFTYIHGVEQKLAKGCENQFHEFSYLLLWRSQSHIIQPPSYNGRGPRPDCSTCYIGFLLHW